MHKFLKVLGWAAASGALSAVATDGLTPMFEGKPKAVAMIAAAGALSAVVTLLKQSPLAEAGDKAALPPPQEPPVK